MPALFDALLLMIQDPVRHSAFSLVMFLEVDVVAGLQCCHALFLLLIASALVLETASVAAFADHANDLLLLQPLRLLRLMWL